MGSTDHAPMREAPRKRTMAVALLVVVALMIGMAEGALRLALPMSDFLQVDLQEDPHLGLVIRPGDTGHDAWGFRNPSVPTQVDIVAVGDSLTYGVNAPRDGSWPMHLQSMVGMSTYNMGLGGFGPLQHLHLTQNLVPKLKPKIQVVAIYMGNDLMDAYSLAHERKHWHGWRLSQRAAGALTEHDVVGEREWQAAQDARTLGGLRDWLSMHSMVYSVLRVVVLGPVAAMLASKKTKAVDLDVLMPWRDPRHPKVYVEFGAQGRLVAMDPTLPAVEEGIKIAERAMQTVATTASGQGHKLVIALLPTKEHVYCNTLALTKAVLPPTHQRLCTVEPQVMARLMTAGHAAGVAMVDTTAALSQAAADGVVLYPPNNDGHPVSAGYRVIATEIARVMR